MDLDDTLHRLLRDRPLRDLKFFQRLRTDEGRRHVEVWSDASKRDWGGIWTPDTSTAVKVLSYPWAPRDQRLHINVKEVLAAYYTCRRWGRFWTGAKVTFNIDSTAAEAHIRRGTAVHHRAARAVAAMWALARKYNFNLVTRWVPTAEQRADAASRLAA